MNKYANAEDVLDGIFVTVEGGAGKLHIFAHFCVEPLGLQVRKGDSSSFMDGVYLPDVFSEFSGGFMGITLFLRKMYRTFQEYKE